MSVQDDYLYHVQVTALVTLSPLARTPWLAAHTAVAPRPSLLRKVARQP